MEELKLAGFECLGGPVRYNRLTLCFYIYLLHALLRHFFEKISAAM